MGNLLGYGLARIRASRDMKQFALAADLNLSQSLISKWENTGDLPAEYWPGVLRAFDIRIDELREEAVAAMARKPVESTEAVDLWRDAVTLQPLIPYRERT